MGRRPLLRCEVEGRRAMRDRDDDAASRKHVRRVAGIARRGVQAEGVLDAYVGGAELGQIAKAAVASVMWKMLVGPEHASRRDRDARELELGQSRGERPRLQARCPGELVGARRAVAKAAQHLVRDLGELDRRGRRRGEPEELEDVARLRQRRRAEPQQVVRPARERAR